MVSVGSSSPVSFLSSLGRPKRCLLQPVAPASWPEKSLEVSFGGRGCSGEETLAAQALSLLHGPPPVLTEKGTSHLFQGTFGVPGVPPDQTLGLPNPKSL